MAITGHCAAWVLCCPLKYKQGWGAWLMLALNTGTHLHAPCRSVSKSISGPWLRSQHIPASQTVGSCLACSHQVFPLVFSYVPVLKLCSQAIPHTCPTQLYEQDYFTSFIFRKQTDQYWAMLNFCQLSPSPSNSKLSCSRESECGVREERVALHSAQGSFCASYISTSCRITWWMCKFK